jgi:hypothetical protein
MGFINLQSSIIILDQKVFQDQIKMYLAKSFHAFRAIDYGTQVKFKNTKNNKT